MGGTTNSGRVITSLHQLAAHGWISLRTCGLLLGYANPRSIYSRQKGKHPISTIRIGGIERVYAEEVITLLKNAPDRDREASNTMLYIYRQALKKQEQKEKAHV